MNAQFKTTATQFIRYGMVGLASNAIGYLVYLLVTHFGAPPKIAMTLLYAVGVTIGFFSNRHFVFSDKGNLHGTGIRFLCAHLCGYLLNLLLLMVFVDMLGCPHELVQAIAIFVVATFLFITFKLFVFRNAVITDRRAL